MIGRSRLSCSVGLLSALLASPVVAQNPVHRLGVGAGTGGTLPFEQVDPLSGNLTVAATDLVLPGNAGLDLRVQRFYNSAIYSEYATDNLAIEEDSWAGIGWRLHFGRILHPDASGSGETQIEMADGSRHPLYTTAAFADGWITRDFWLYNRTNHTLKLPNGMVYTFDRLVHLSDTLGDARYVTEIRDPFGNRLEFTYFDSAGPPDGVQQIRQVLSPTEERVVTFTYSTSAKSLHTMQYGSRTWTYNQEPVGTDGMSRLRAVQPPAGGAWSYEYYDTTPGHELKKITTPLGGTVSYAYADAFHRTGPVTTRTRAVSTRTTGGRIDDPATSTYTYDTGPNQDTTEVTTNCATARYRFYGHGLSGTFAPLTAGALAERTVESAGTVYEHETLEYIASEPVSPDYVPGDEGVASSNGVFNALLSRRVLQRDQQTWTTEVTYRSGEGTFNDFGQPWRIKESTGFYHFRETTRTYQHGFSPYIRARLVGQLVEVRLDYSHWLWPAGDTWSYDPATGFLTGQTVAGLTTTFEPDSNGNVGASIDGAGYRTTYAYQWGQAREQTTALLTTSSTINPDGTIAWTGIGTLGVGYGYDDAFRVTTIDTDNGPQTTIAYDGPDGAVTTTRKDASGLHDVTSTVSLDGFGRTQLTLGADGVKTRTSYQNCGTIFQSAPYTNGLGTRGTTTDFDPLGRPSRVTDADGAGTTYSYNGPNTVVEDAERRVFRYDYDPFGGPVAERLVSVTDPDNKTTRYQYDARNQLVQADVPGVPSRTWSYDGARLMSETHPESGTTTYTHYDNGQVKTSTNALNEVTTFLYDEIGRLARIDAPGTADDVTLTYEDGRLKTRSNSAVTTTLRYDAGGRLAERSDAVDGRTFTSTYEYWSDESLKKITYPSGRQVTYEYDTIGRLSEVKNNGVPFATAFTYAYAGDFGDMGALASYVTGGVTHTFRLDGKNRLKQVTSLNASAQGLDLTFGYDKADQVKTIADPRANASQAFTYDAVGRLSTAAGPWGSLAWVYDAAGNRLTETTSSAVTTYTYDTSRQWLTAISGPASETFAYDSLGRLTQDSRGTYGYTASSQLASATAAQLTAAYRYDGAGARVARTVNGVTNYTIRSASGEPLSEYQIACGTLVWTRDTIYAAGRPLGAVRANLDAPAVSMASEILTVSEATGSAAVAVRVTTPGGGPTSCPITVSYSTLTGTARAADVALVSGTLTIAAGTASGATVPINVPVLPDAFDEFDETFRVILTSATGARVGAAATTEVTILDDDPPPAVSIGDVQGVEGDLAEVPIVFTVGLSTPSGKPVSVNYAFMDLTATASADYQTETGTYSGTLTFPPGVGAVQLRVWVLPDLLDETLERFRITLSNPSNATLGTATALGTIVDNDPTILSVTNPVVHGGDRARFAVTLSSPADDWITVRWGTADGTARVGIDYSAQSGVLTFAPGDSTREVEVQTILDAPERDEQFYASLYSATGPVLLPAGPATATIVNRKKGDLTGDGWPDFLWQHRVDGSVVVWTMEGVTRTGYPYLSPQIPESGGTVAGVADFTGDGYQDVVFQTAAGAIEIWAMRNLERTAILTPSATVQGDANWRVRAVGDFNGDGCPDLAFQHLTSDYVALWLMQGLTVVASELTTVPQVDADVWRIAGAGDMNGDGRDDLLWQDEVSGYLAAWLLNGPVVVNSVSLVPGRLQDPTWHLRAVADLTGDGQPDLVWHHDTGDWLTVWVMTGVTRDSNLTPTPGAVPASTWRLAGPR